MLNYRLVFLIVGIAAGALGFGVGNVGGTATTLAKLVAITCFVLLIGSYIDRKY